MGEATEGRFLGGLLGMAIGDALGMPVTGRGKEGIALGANRVETYEPRTLGDGTDVAAGEFTDETEVALCIVESLTTNDGRLDPGNIGARLGYLAQGESRRWLGADTARALARAEASGSFRVPLDEDGPATGDVASRGVPIGLLHARGTFDPVALRRDAETVTRLTHGSPAAITATTAVAYAVYLAATDAVSRLELAGRTAALLETGELAQQLRAAADLVTNDVPAAEAMLRLGTGAAAAESVPAGLYAAMMTVRFEDAVLTAVNAGGAADTIGALAGAIAGASCGAAGIPQRLIDGLQGRIYVSLAAPWFYRTALRRAGTIIDLRPTPDS